jgi:hypothetical protein
MAGVVFLLCGVASVAALGLLVRAYRASGGRLVKWAAVCFAGLAVNNVLLAIDELVLTSDEVTWRAIPGAIGLLAFVYALTFEELRYRRRRRPSIR